MLWLTEAARVLLEIADTDIASPLLRNSLFRMAGGATPNELGVFITGNSAWIRHDQYQTRARSMRAKYVHFTIGSSRGIFPAAPTGSKIRQEMPTDGQQIVPTRLA